MHFKDQESEEQFKKFILEIAAIFEENCLPLIEKEADVEKALFFAIDYCLDQRKHR